MKMQKLLLIIVVLHLSDCFAGGAVTRVRDGERPGGVCSDPNSPAYKDCVNPLRWYPEGAEWENNIMILADLREFRACDDCAYNGAHYYWWCGDPKAHFISKNGRSFEVRPTDGFPEPNGYCARLVHKEKARIPVCRQTVGNPLVPTTGTKRETFDIAALPQSLLNLKFTFDSTNLMPKKVLSNGIEMSNVGFYDVNSEPPQGVLGRNWSSSLHRSYHAPGATETVESVDLGDGDFIGVEATPYSPIEVIKKTEFDPDCWCQSVVEVLVRNVKTSEHSLFKRVEAAHKYDDWREIRRWTPDGRFINFIYSDSQTDSTTAPESGILIAAEDQFGRQIGFSYKLSQGGSSILTRVNLPGGAVINLSSDASGRLESVSWADGTATTFLYERGDLPYALTGVVREDSKQFSSFEYDTRGTAISTEHAGGVQRYSIQYETPPYLEQGIDGTLSVTEPFVSTTRFVPPQGVKITGPLGQTSVIAVQNPAGIVRSSGQTQPAGSGCDASAQTSTFNQTTATRISSTDFNGRKTCFKYGDAGTSLIESVRVEGLDPAVNCNDVLADGAPLPAGARKISTSSWSVNGPDDKAAPLKKSLQAYNGAPNFITGSGTASCAPGTARLPDGSPMKLLCKTVEQATTDVDGSKGFAATPQAGVPSRVWQYSYNEFGQVLTAKDPLNNTTSYAYYADTTAEHTRGDLQSVTNPLNQVTQYTKYNPQGQVLQMMDANGVITDYGYDLRQRLTSVSVAGANSSYEYWPTGLLKRAVQPDGSFVAYEYDDAHRLTAVADAKGNRIEYTLDNAGNRTAEAVKDPAGNLARQLARVHDALGRVQQISGREQ